MTISIGTLVGVMIITLILAFFFPQEVMSMSQGLGESFTSASFWVSMFLVAVIPAICEEAVFRGVLLNSLWSINNKWLVIVIIGGVFGVCHGSIWRFFPTALLGMMLTYIIIETNNILYSSFMHFINNLLPLVMMYALQSVVKVSQGVGTQDMYNTSITGIPLMSVAIYMLIGTMIPFCIYIGNYLLHKGQKGAPVRLFPEENRRTLYFLIALTGVIFVCGICLMIGSSYLQLVV